MQYTSYDEYNTKENLQVSYVRFYWVIYLPYRIENVSYDITIHI